MCNVINIAKWTKDKEELEIISRVKKYSYKKMLVDTKYHNHIWKVNTDEISALDDIFNRIEAYRKKYKTKKKKRESKLYSIEQVCDLTGIDDLDIGTIIRLFSKLGFFCRSIIRNIALWKSKIDLDEIIIAKEIYLEHKNLLIRIAKRRDMYKSVLLMGRSYNFVDVDPLLSAVTGISHRIDLTSETRKVKGVISLTDDT